MLNIADVVTPKFRATSVSVIPKFSIRVRCYPDVLDASILFNYLFFIFKKYKLFV
jgi:hypothetical protein